jgi:hypothetical protein
LRGYEEYFDRIQAKGRKVRPPYLRQRIYWEKGFLMNRKHCLEYNQKCSWVWGICYNPFWKVNLSQVIFWNRSWLGSNPNFLLFYSILRLPSNQYSNKLKALYHFHFRTYKISMWHNFSHTHHHCSYFHHRSCF